MGGQCAHFIFRHIDHEIAAAISTGGAINLWGDEGIQFLYKLIYIICILGLQEGSECEIFSFLFFSSECDIFNCGC